MEHQRFEVVIPPAGLGGFLDVPDKAKGVILFVHGSGSSRFSPRNNYVAKSLNGAGFATLLFDLLTEEEGGDRSLVFDIPFLAGRLVDAAIWVQARKDMAALPLGFFGASTGAGAALVAEPRLGGGVKAIVSRGGRPDLADDESLARVRAATLLIVGGDDAPVIDLNEKVLPRLNCAKQLVIVPGATHLFEEPGALDQVIELATDWFEQRLTDG